MSTSTSLAGFWKRIFALLIDGLILGIVGQVLIVFLREYLIPLGPMGRLIGLVIAYPYFAILNSSIGNGQTLGKRIFKLQVVDAQGKTISLAKASIRYVILYAPIFLNGFFLPANDPSSTVFMLVSLLLFVIVFGGLVAIVYLYIANSRTRQSLHDLAVGSYVRRMDVVWACPALSIKKMHLSVVGIWVVILVVGFIIMDNKAEKVLTTDSTFSQLANVQKTVIASDPDILQAVIGRNTINGSKTVLEVAVMYKHKIENPDKVLRDIAAKILAQYPDILGSEALRITTKYGADIGIANYSFSSTDIKTAAEWKAEIALTAH